MDTTPVNGSPSELEEKLSSYWQLMDDRDAVQKRIDAAKREKNTVSERVYLRVVGDYESELEGIVARLEPLKQELDALRRSTEEAISELEATLVTMRDELLEAEFRHRVGEFDDTRLEEAVHSLRPRVEEQENTLRDLKGCLEALDRRRPNRSRNERHDETGADERDDRRGDPAASDPPAEPEPSAEPKPSAAPESSAMPEPSDTPTAETDDDVKWATPWESPAKGAQTAGEEESAPKARAEDYDPLAALADPVERPAERRSNGTPSFPNLVIRSGSHASRIVPLLPMTMSVGREHDNNIELKDPEVARYHARIVYEDGRFFIEDLESSTGTWVNGENAKRRQLEEGDIIRIGESDLAVEYS